MLKAFFTLALPAMLLFACSNGNKEYPVTDTEAATSFIRYLLDNKLEEAENMVIQDEENKQYFDILRQQYAKKNKSELQKYHDADIIINEISPVTDSLTIVNYSNTVNRDSKNKIKVVRVNGKWMIDLKYTFSGNL